MSQAKSQSACAVGAIALAAADYAWAFGYYRGLYQSGKLLSAARASGDTLGAFLTQNLPPSVNSIAYLPRRYARSAPDAKPAGQSAGAADGRCVASRHEGAIRPDDGIESSPGAKPRVSWHCAGRLRVAARRGLAPAQRKRPGDRLAVAVLSGICGAV